MDKAGLNGRAQEEVKGQGYTPMSHRRPRLTWRQWWTCKHYHKFPVYEKWAGVGGEMHLWLSHYECAWCGRRIENPHRRRRMSVYPILMCLGLAALLLACWWLSGMG